MIRKTLILITILALGFSVILGEDKPNGPDNPVVLNGDTIPDDRITRNTAEYVVTIDLSEMEISDPNCLQGIENYSATLGTLILAGNELTSIDLAPLSSCSNLERLNLGWNELTSIDLNPLSSCSNLEKLLLAGNDLTSIDLNPLSSCSNLERLRLNDNQLTTIDLNPLSSYSNLEWLSINDNQLTSIDLTPIWELNSLSSLYLQGNKLESTSCDQVCNFIDEHPDRDVRTDCDYGG